MIQAQSGPGIDTQVGFHSDETFYELLCIFHKQSYFYKFIVLTYSYTSVQHDDAQTFHQKRSREQIDFPNASTNEQAEWNFHNVYGHQLSPSLTNKGPNVDDDYSDD